MPQAVDRAGNIWEVDAQGNPMRYVGKAGDTPAPVTLGRPNAAKVLGDNLSNTKTTLDIQRTQATMDADRRKAEADARKAVADADKAEKDAKTANGLDPQKLANLRALENLLNELTDQYNKGPGATKGYEGWRDYLPSDANSQFDTTGASIGDVGFAAFRVPGSGTQSDADLRNFVNANTPSASDRDVSIEQKINNVRNRLNATYEQYGITPQKSVQIGAQYESGAGKTELATGKDKAIPIPAEMQAEYAAFLKANPRGKLPPEAYAAKRLELNQKYGLGYSPGDYDTYLLEGKAYNEQLNRPFNMTLPAMTGQTTQNERDKAAPFVGDGIMPKVKAAGANFADMVGGGIPTAIVGQDVMGGIQQAQPGASLVGDVAGALAGTWGLNKLGAETVGKVTPKLVPKSQFLRSLIGDTAYGTIYKGIADGDPVGGAVESAIGSGGGQLAGKTIGATLKGVTAPAQTLLRKAGVPLTVGQAVRNSGPLGRFVAGVEDLTANAGPLGSMVQARRLEGLEDANKAAFNIGANGKGVVTAIGGEGVDQLGNIKNQAYSDALNGVNLTPDPTFTAQIQAANTAGRGVDVARGRGDFGYIMDNQVGPIAGNSPTISGKQLQDIMRTTQGGQRAYTRAANGLQPDPMAQGVADALGGVNNAVTGLTARQAPSVIPKLKEANQINRNFLILDDAANSTTDGMFTGAGLNAAVRRNVRGLFGRSSKAMVNKQPLAKFGQAMHEVLPNQIPQTGVNAAPTLALLGGLGLGGGAGAMAGDAKEGAGYGLTLGALTTLASTKEGQKMIVSALMDRPDAARFLGSKIGQHSGYLGMAGSGYLLGNQ